MYKCIVFNMIIYSFLKLKHRKNVMFKIQVLKSIIISEINEGF